MHVLKQKAKALNRLGRSLGNPVGQPRPLDDRVCVQEHEQGWVVSPDGLSAFELRGAILQEWLSRGGDSGDLGWPITDEIPIPGPNGSVIQHFAHGTVAWDASNGACKTHTDAEIDRGPKSILESLRRLQFRLFRVALWVAAGIGTILLSGGLLWLANGLFDFATRLRQALGSTAPSHGPDWIMIGLLAAVFAAPVVLGAVALLWYQRHWGRRMRRTWAGVDGFSPVARFRAAQARTTEWQARYLLTLARTGHWSLLPAARNAIEQGGSPKALREFSESVLGQIRREAFLRATTLGLIVGVSRRPWLDTVSIAAGALEIQLALLTLLGKRPSPRAWRLMLERSLGSVAINTFLNREESFMVSLAIKRAAMGLSLGADLAAGLGEQVETLDLTEFVDELDELGGTVASLLKSGASIAFGAGANGARLLSRLVDSYGDEILEGVVAGTLLFHHGMQIAAETLAVDERHLAELQLRESFSTALKDVASFACRLVRDQILLRRRALKERRINLMKIWRRRRDRGSDELEQPEDDDLAQREEVLAVARKRGLFGRLMNRIFGQT